MSHPPQIFITPEDRRGELLVIAGEKYHHLARVCRARVGDHLRAVLPDGRVLFADIIAITADVLTARVTGDTPASGISPCRITLCQAVLKGEKMEMVVQKASELGVHRLRPLLAQRSIPRWTPAQAAERAARWQRIADAAAEQCERSLPLQVDVPCSLPAAVEGADSLRVLLHERDGEPLPALAASYPAPDAVTLFIGPEGGWSDDETATLRAAGALPLHLGCRILRAETATLAAVTLLQYVWGDLG